MNREDLAELVLTAILPGSSMWDAGQTQSGVETIGLAAAGLNRTCWNAVLARVCGDRAAARDLWGKLRKLAEANQYPQVRAIAGPLASLVLAEDSTGPLLSITGTAPALLGISRREYQGAVRMAHLRLRAQLDTWARRGINHIARRIRG